MTAGRPSGRSVSELACQLRESVSLLGGQFHGLRPGTRLPLLREGGERVAFGPSGDVLGHAPQ
ncbi:hypothetical protein QF034_003336 [Streptomyces africanus]|uniref:Uncharacterized protein n=1 Tax=Streptomyces africanus TaxID=231024 RepID=A0ABU0QNZ0_9ACTN|nr:hypothetical protein [Streptomyces africanus]